MEKECLLCHDLTEAGVHILPKNMSLNSVFQEKLDCCIFGTLGHLDNATEAVWRRYVFLLCFMHWSTWPLHPLCGIFQILNPEKGE